MDECERLASQFEDHRTHLRAVAYRMLGSPSEADDAVQEAWIRLSRSDASDIANLRARRRVPCCYTARQVERLCRRKCF